MHDDLNDTLIFARVVQDGSFTQAAKSLQLPKTTVSRKLQALEARLGVPLLHRTTRKSTLTEAGAVFYEHAQRVAHELKLAHAAVAQFTSGPKGHLRVSAPHSFAITWITPLLSAFCARYPEVRIELLLGNEPLDVLAKDIDVALRLGRLPSSGLVARRLGIFPMHIYGSTAYLAQFGTPTHPNQLATHRALVLPLARQDKQFFWKLRPAASAAINHSADSAPLQAFAVTPVLEASDPEALYAPLLDGMGLMQIMGINVQRHVDAGVIRQVLPDWEGPQAEFNAVFPQGHGRSPKVRVFLDFLIEQLRFAPEL